jgi:hypothetical protein
MKIENFFWCKFNFIWSHIYLWNKVVCFVLFVTQRSPKALRFMPHSWYLQKALSMSKGAPTWFKTIWSYNVKAIDHWTIFSMTTKKNWNWKLYWNLRVFLALLQSPLNKSDLIKFISQFSELRYGRYWFLSVFCCWNFK